MREYLLWGLVRAAGRFRSSPESAAKAALALHLHCCCRAPCLVLLQPLVSKRKIHGVKQTWVGSKDSSDHCVKGPVFFRINWFLNPVETGLKMFQIWQVDTKNSKFARFYSKCKSDTSFRIVEGKLCLCPFALDSSKSWSMIVVV